jgi:hypothetical protein
MDNGWGVESTFTVLTEESVTTSNQDGMNGGVFAYTGVINADIIYVTFNGTRYECHAIDFNDYKWYGGFSALGPAFTEYPFIIRSDTTGDSGNILFTEAEGTYTVKIETVAKTIEVSDTFKEAVGASVDTSNTPKILRCIESVTNITDVQNFLNDGGIVYFTAPATAGGTDNSLFFINTPGNPGTIFPESATLKAVFGRDDGLFHIYYL